MASHSRRRRRFYRWLQKRKGFLLAVVILLLMGWGYRIAILVFERQALRLASLQNAMQEAKYRDDSIRVFNLTRELEYARLEPIFYALFVLIPVSLVSIGIIFIYYMKTPQHWDPNVPKNDWIDVARQKRTSRYRDGNN